MGHLSSVRSPLISDVLMTKISCTHTSSYYSCLCHNILYCMALVFALSSVCNLSFRGANFYSHVDMRQCSNTHTMTHEDTNVNWDLKVQWVILRAFSRIFSSSTGQIGDIFTCLIFFFEKLKLKK